MSGTEMDMVGVSFWPFVYSNLLFLQNIAPQIFNEGATEDKGEMARLVSTLLMVFKNSASNLGAIKIIQKNIMINLYLAILRRSHRCCRSREDHSWSKGYG